MIETLSKIWSNVLGFSTKKQPTSIAVGWFGIGFVISLILGVTLGQTASMYWSFVVLGGIVLNFLAGWYLSIRNKTKSNTPNIEEISKEKVENEIPKAEVPKMVSRVDWKSSVEYVETETITDDKKTSISKEITKSDSTNKTKPSPTTGKKTTDTKNTKPNVGQTNKRKPTRKNGQTNPGKTSTKNTPTKGSPKK